MFYTILNVEAVMSVTSTAFTNNVAQVAPVAAVAATVVFDTVTFEDNECTQDPLCAIGIYVSTGAHFTLVNTMYMVQSGPTQKPMLIAESDGAMHLSGPQPSRFCGDDTYAPPFAIQCVGSNQVTLEERSGYKGKKNERRSLQLLVTHRFNFYFL
jgi:hypothetical protein